MKCQFFRLLFKCTGRESNPYALRRRNLKTSEAEAALTIPQDSASSANGYAPDETRSGRLLPRDAAACEPDAVDTALATALTAAAIAGRFDIVAQLDEELEARRLARSNEAAPDRTTP